MNYYKWWSWKTLPGPWTFSTRLSFFRSTWPLWDVGMGSLLHLTWGPLNWSSSWIKPLCSVECPQSRWSDPIPAGLLNGPCTALNCLVFVSFLPLFSPDQKATSISTCWNLPCSSKPPTWSGRSVDVILLSCKASSYTVPLGWASWGGDTPSHQTRNCFPEGPCLRHFWILLLVLDKSLMNTNLLNLTSTQS